MPAARPSSHTATAAAIGASTERVLSIDSALRNTGWAVVEKMPTGRDSFRTLAYGVITNSPKLLPSGCLVAIREQLCAIIRTHAPTVCAIESTIFVQSFKTAISLGTARGAALIAAAEHGLPIYEYAPREVKQAAVGRGAAQKEQVAFMIRSLLHLKETPPADAADALAVAIAHFQSHDARMLVQREAKRI